MVAIDAHDVYNGLREHQEILIMNLPHLKDVYKWTLSRSAYLFLNLFKSFTQRFSQLREIGELLNMVHDVLTVDVFNRTSYIQDVVFGLRNAGMDFKSAIGTLIEHKTEKQDSLLDVLLDLVVNSNENLVENWVIVEKILKHSSRDIDFLSVIIKKTLKSGDR